MRYLNPFTLKNVGVADGAFFIVNLRNIKCNVRKHLGIISVVAVGDIRPKWLQRLAIILFSHKKIEYNVINYRIR